MPTSLVMPSIVFGSNQYGHIIFSITGLDLSGKEEILLLEGIGYGIGDYAKQMFMSTKEDGYDAKHRLVAGQEYSVVLLPTACIADTQKRTTKNLLAEGKNFGYGKSLAGSIPRIREGVSDKQIKDAKFQYVVPLHDPITGDGEVKRVFNINLRLFGPWIRSYREDSGPWLDDGAVALFAN